MSLTKKQIEAAQNACLEQYHCSPSGQMLETIASHVQMASEAEPPSEEEVIVADEAYDETDSFDRSYAPMRNSLTAVFKGRSDRIKALEKKCADWEAEFSEARQDALKASVAMHKIADERDALKAESERRKIIVLTCLSCRKSFKDLKMLSDHIGVCEKHPMRALKDKLEDLLASSVTEDQVREAVVLAHDYLHTSIHSGQDVAVEVCSHLFPKKASNEG